MGNNKQPEEKTSTNIEPITKEAEEGRKKTELIEPPIEYEWPNDKKN